MAWTSESLLGELTKRKKSALTGGEQQEAIDFLKRQGWSGGDISDQQANDILYTADQRWPKMADPDPVPTVPKPPAVPTPTPPAAPPRQEPVYPVYQPPANPTAPKVGPYGDDGRAHSIDDGHAIPVPPAMATPIDPLYGGTPAPPLQRAALPMAGWWGADDAALDRWIDQHYLNKATLNDQTRGYWRDRIKEKPGDAGYWAGRMADGGSPSPTASPVPTPPAPPAAPVRRPSSRVATNWTGSEDAAVAYVDNEARKMIGRPLSADEWQLAIPIAQQAGYQKGQPIGASIVNAILGAMDQYFGASGTPSGPPGPTGPTPTPGPTATPTPPALPPPTIPGVPVTPYSPNIFTDPAAQLLEDLSRARLNELFAPVEDPYLGRLTDAIQRRIAEKNTPIKNAALDDLDRLLQERITSLQGAPFTDQQEQAIRAKLFDQLEQNRQSEIKSAVERLAALGHGSTSGTIQEAINQVNKRYDQLRAQAENNFATMAIDRARENANQVLDLGGQRASLVQGLYDTQEGRLDEGINLQSTLAELAAQTRAEEQARRREAMTTTGMLAELPVHRLQIAEQAAGMGVTPDNGLMNSLVSLLDLNNRQTESAANRRTNLVGGLGSIIGAILAGQGGRATAAAPPAASPGPWAGGYAGLL